MYCNLNSNNSIIIYIVCQNGPLNLHCSQPYSSTRDARDFPHYLTFTYFTACK